MALTLVQSFDHSKISAKGVCFRLAVKWAVSTLCGHGVNYFLSDEVWLQDKQQRAPNGKWKTRLEAARNELPAELRELVLAKRPTTGVETARWEGTRAKHAEYAQASEAATTPLAVQTADRDALVSWSTRIAARHGKKVQMQPFDLASKHNKVHLACGTGMFPADATLVLGYLFNNGDTVGGHTLACSGSKLFDPSDGVYESDASTAELRGLDIDKHVDGKYGPCDTLVCYVLRLG